ncbi:MAG: DNA mismatch repair endonuclease MutL [Treponema sp.]|nr:DNA mismatch repair endonuclease MutL [Treponema sp.]
MSINHPVRKLNAEVARKIAAGEVIDRPNAIVRELMDNAIDSGASSIIVEISGGGIDKVRIVDNGSGMTKEDLAECARPHATSKISTETDLLNLSTLGFRGEALASIAAVCRLSILSGGYRMKASVTEDHIIEPATPLEGTIVCAEGLFENFPARRQFLKRPASEGILCRSTFAEKVLPQTGISFRFIQDGTVRLDLPKDQSLSERFVKAMEIRENSSLFSEISARSSENDPDWSFTVVIGEPGIFRSNKKDIYIFVNGRRIQEYSLVQAIEYGSQGYFPNGNFPVAAAFITMRPSLVDFNIHPAKKEARFKDIASLHHGISTAVKSFFSEYTNRTMKKQAETVSPAAKELFSPESLAQMALNSISKEPAAHSVPEKTYSPSYPISEKSRYYGGISASSFAEQSKSSGWTGFSSRPNFGSPEYKIRKQAESLFSTPRTSAGQEAYSPSTPSYSAASLQAQNTQGSENTRKIKEKMDEVISLYTGKPAEPQSQPQIPVLSTEKAPEALQQDQLSQSLAQKKTEIAPDFHFIGSALGTFIIAEQNNTLYIIDKHAAHERMIFDQIIESQGKSQNLLIPYVITTENKEDDDYLERIKDELKKTGFTCQNIGAGRWEFLTIPERWHGTEEDLKHDLLDKKIRPQDIIYSIAAMTACKAAVKDGWILDDDAAEKIARGALALPDPHCPHGRPCYTTITRETLFSLVRRTDY